MFTTFTNFKGTDVLRFSFETVNNNEISIHAVSQGMTIIINDNENNDIVLIDIDDLNTKRFAYICKLKIEAYAKMYGEKYNAIESFYEAFGCLMLFATTGINTAV